MDSSWIKVRRLRKAYQRVFMPTITSKSSFEDRLAELVRILAHHRFTSICACIYLNLNQQEQEVELSESPAVSCMVESIRMSFVQGHRGICKFRSWNSSWMCQFLNYLGSYLRRYLGNLVQHCYFFFIMHCYFFGDAWIVTRWFSNLFGYDKILSRIKPSRVALRTISASWCRSTAQFWRSVDCFPLIIGKKIVLFMFSATRFGWGYALPLVATTLSIWPTITNWNVAYDQKLVLTGVSIHRMSETLLQRLKS